MQPGRVSGFVVTYNRAALLETCLRSIRFVDELIVIDKSSTDGTRAIAKRYADRVITVPWSPTESICRPPKLVRNSLRSRPTPTAWEAIPGIGKTIAKTNRQLATDMLR